MYDDGTGFSFLTCHISVTFFFMGTTYYHYFTQEILHLLGLLCLRLFLSEIQLPM